MEAAKPGDTSKELLEAAAQTVKNFELDLQIMDELEHYKEHKEVLGKHPIFWERMLKQAVKNYTGIELVRRQTTLRANISRDKKKLLSIKDKSKKQKFEAKLKQYVIELELVDERINRSKE